MAITINKNFERVAVSYFNKFTSEELIKTIAKKIRKMSRKLAEEIIERMEINIIIKEGIQDDKNSLGVIVKNK